MLKLVRKILVRGNTKQFHQIFGPFVPPLLSGLKSQEFLMLPGLKSQNFLSFSLPVFKISNNISRRMWKSDSCLYVIVFENLRIGKTRSGGMGHLRVEPWFLHSNATIHKWALGALAELLGNSLAEVRTGANYVNVDVLDNEKDTHSKMLPEVVSFIKKDGGERIIGARIRDNLSGTEFDTYAKVVVNAGGPFCDSVENLADKDAKLVICPSSGVHIVLPDYYSPEGMGSILEITPTATPPSAEGLQLPATVTTELTSQLQQPTVKNRAHEHLSAGSC